MAVSQRALGRPPTAAERALLKNELAVATKEDSGEAAVMWGFSTGQENERAHPRLPSGPC